MDTKYVDKGAPFIYLQWLPVAWEDAMAELDQTGGTEGTDSVSTGTGAGGAGGVRWGGDGLGLGVLIKKKKRGRGARM